MSRLLQWTMRYACVLTITLPAAAQETRVPQEAINGAVDRGVTWLLNQQRRDGSWGENDMTPGVYRDPRNDLTAFCTYTLLKCKVPYEHASIQRALTNLEQNWPWTTYAVTNQILLLSLCEDDARWKKRREQLLELLIELRYEAHGTWGYPKHTSIKSDLSNTQYAALALRAASANGAKIPKDIWTELVERVLEHQEEPHDSIPAQGKPVRNPPQKAGFAYLLPNPDAPSFGYNVPNASMTTAGLAILRIAQQELGSKYPNRLERRAKQATELAMQWMADHFSVENNTAGEQAWLYYYLYGLQRLGALYELDEIGGHNWYWEGATQLVKLQQEDGHWEQGTYQQWPRQPMPHANTAYALLFLVKAMAPVSNGSSENHGRYASEGSESPVHFRAAVRGSATCWVSGFGKGVLEANTLTSPDAKGMFVKEVRYYIDGKLANRTAGDASKPWNGERYGTQLDIAGNGSFALQVGVLVRSESKEGGEHELLSETVTLVISGILEDWMMARAAFEKDNQLAKANVTATASSASGEFTGADRAVDGIEASRWLCLAGDSRPTLTLDIPQAVWADTLVLSQADSQLAELGRHARVKRIAFRINGSKRASEVELGADVLRPSAFPLPKRVRVRSVLIEILEFEAGSEFAREAGFSEVGLTDRR